jgi:putative ABC transport system ATP-binding protein
MSELIKCEQICKYYQMGSETVHALDDINLSVNTGEYIAILGKSGSGKSTLMNILGCLDTPTSGRYYLDGQDVSGLSQQQLAYVRNQKIGFIFQGFHLLPHASALDNVALPLLYRGVSVKARRAKAQAFLEQVGLGNRIAHLPGELSGGQQQRVAIARALITEPALLLADEPTGNLDSQSGEEVMQIFDKLIAAGKTIMVVTHDNHLAKQMQRIIRLQDGKILT